MAAGFVHGVLNTDNMNITGESFDYGPYRFLPRYDPNFVAAYFDQTGLYAFGRQPRPSCGTSRRFAEALSPLCPDDGAGARGRGVRAAFRERASGAARAPRGRVAGAGRRPRLVDAVFAFLEESLVPLRPVLLRLGRRPRAREEARAGPAAERHQRPSYEALRGVLAGYRPAHPERLEAAYFQGDAPCSLLIDEVRRIRNAIAARDDWRPFGAKVEAIRALGGCLAELGRSDDAEDTAAPWWRPLRGST